MLLGMKNCPKDICAPLSFLETVAYLGSIFSLFAIDAALYSVVKDVAFRKLQLETKTFLLGISGMSIVITAGLYIYFVEVVHRVARKQGESSDSKKNK